MDQLDGDAAYSAMRVAPTACAGDTDTEDDGTATPGERATDQDDGEAIEDEREAYDEE